MTDTGSTSSGSQGYYRFPTIHDDRVVFACEGDLWSVPATGGSATRLTSNPGQASVPSLSPDGTLLAFTGRDEGHAEVYCMPSLGGPAERLTYLGGDSRVVGWHPDGQSITFASSAAQPFLKTYKLYGVGAAGGDPWSLPTGPAMSISHGPGAGMVIGRNTTDIARWKRYRGGLTGDLWIDEQGDGGWRRLIDLDGNVAMPLWLGDRVFFVSDHEGIGNLYSCDVAGHDLLRHTHHEDYYARHPATDGRRIVYHAGADLYLFDPAGKEHRRIDVDFRSPKVQRKRKFVSASRYLQDSDVHPEGHSVAVTARGKVYTMANWEGAVVQHGEMDGVRYRLAAWLSDGERLVLVSDATGEETIEIHDADASSEPDRLSGLDIGRPVSLAAAPHGDRVALTNHRHELIVVDLADRSARVIDRSSFDRIYGVAWSPDGRWVAYGFANSMQTSIIRLCEVETGQVCDATRAVLHDVGPAFDPDGKYLYFLSYREFNPVYDNLHFDLNFPRGAKPYLLTLQADAPSPFVPVPRAPGQKPKDDLDDEAGDADADEADETDDADESDSDESADEADGGDGSDEGNGQLAAASSDSAVEDDGNGVGDDGDDTDKDAESDDAAEHDDVEPIRIDTDGIAERVMAFPVAEGRYGQVRGIEGQALFTRYPIRGTLGTGDYDDSPSGVLESYGFDEQKLTTLASDVGAFDVSADCKTLIYRTGGRLRVAKAGDKLSDSYDSPSRKSGWLSLGRIRISVRPGAEWEQMYKEAWRLQRDHFWTEDMSGIDWQVVYLRYLPLVERIASRAEFSDLMWEMQGELGTSHAYEFGGDYPPEPAYMQGFLGADLEYDEPTDSYRVAHIVRGDVWSERGSSPLARPGVDVRVGDRILAVGGRGVGRELSPAECLVHQAGTEMLLTIARDSDAPQAEDSTTAPADPTADPTAATGDRTSADAGTDESTSGSKDAAIKPRTVTVKTLRGETEARYREWVDANRKAVHDATDGRVGYVHVPDMGARGYAEFHRGYLAEVAREGLIVDARFNGGGHVSQLILEKLARRRLGYDTQRWGDPIPYPYESVMGPIVAMCNELAGSDGDIFSHAFKMMGLGPLIGKRTWGGVIGINMRNSLVDGGMTTQPEYSFWFQDIKWGLENYGTEPDIEVEILPQDYVAGTDPQLERAISEIQAAMKENPPAVPEFGDRPRLGLPTLPD